MRAITVAVLLSIVALAYGYIVPGEKYKYADEEFLKKQKVILEIVQHVHQVNKYSQYYKDAVAFKIEDHYDLYENVEAVKEFVKFYNFGMLPKGEVFSIMDDQHRDWAVSLFHVLYYAKTWDAFYHSMVWAAYHCNEGMFVYALTVAVLHRHDMAGMELPAPYEIYPYYFFNTEVIQKAQNYKMQRFEGVKKVDGIYNVVIPSNYTSWYLYTNDEQKVSYFTEDIGLNSYYYYFHTDYPFWMGGSEYNLYKDRRGEMYLYIHQQLLARYYVERLSNDLGEIPELSYYYPVEVGYYPNIRYYNGMFFPVRDNNYHVYNKHNYYAVMQLEDYERRIRDAIDYGYVIMPDGKYVDLTKPESVEYLGNMMQGNPDMKNYEVYKYIAMYAQVLLGGSYPTMGDYTLVPSVLEHFETAMRDPVFYMLYKRLISYYWQFKEKLPYYKYEEIYYPEVKIEKVEVDKLVTYFDKFDVDITNAVDYAYPPVEPVVDVSKHHKVQPEFLIKARQWRLNHLPFTVKLHVHAEKAVKSVVRVFFGPKYDSYGNAYGVNENRENFYLLDEFVYDMVPGENVVVRNSQEFTWYVKDRTSKYDLYKMVMDAYDGTGKFPLDMTEAHCGFPQRLMLPKGKKMGMPFQFYFIITPYVAPSVEPYSTFDPVISCGVGSGSRFLDALPFGFPFDRNIDETTWFTPNMKYFDVNVYHKKEMEINTSY